jgi:hypothetical protein
MGCDIFDTKISQHIFAGPPGDVQTGCDFVPSRSSYEVCHFYPPERDKVIQLVWGSTPTQKTTQPWRIRTPRTVQNPHNARPDMVQHHMAGLVPTRPPFPAELEINAKRENLQIHPPGPFSAPREQFFMKITSKCTET